MGGTTILKELGEGLGLLTRSTEHSFSVSPIGKDLVEFIKNDIEPTIGKQSAHLMQQINPATQMRYTPPEAMKIAREATLDAAFGSKRQGLLPIIQAAKQQKGDIHASTMANGMNVLMKDENSAIGWRSKVAKMGVPIKISSFYTSPSSFEKAIKTGSGRMFLPLISIPHAFQAPLNSLLVNGLADTLRAFAEFTFDSSSAKKLALDSGALSQDLVYEHLNIMKGRSMFGTMLDPLKSLFGLERKLGVAFSAVGGKWSALRAAEEYFQTSSKRAELQLKLLGLDPALIKAQRGILSQADIEQAAFRSASEIMGMRSQLETPFHWEANALGRFTTLYKHYGFRQARLIKNMLIKSYQGEGILGAMKIVSAIAIAFPIAGELIKGAEGALTLQNPWSPEHKQRNFANSEYLDAIANAGGFGMAYSITRSARSNHLGGYLMGPHISTGVDLAQDIMNARGTNVTKDVLRRFGLPGRAVANTIFPSKKKSKTSTSYKGSHY